ncbi:MAG: hypothetical protein EZS28_044394 [Streblomastix strix]|uniref:Uncharacterized protein n=1 Tax=Streblomastix strix TaxID=222440 RepID=A0A5J4TRK4_9EUKA|nr:MAG: hypothetical protein EZS28_044394 [Streblomastix strix]
MSDSLRIFVRIIASACAKKIGEALIAWEKFKPKSIVITPRWPGQISFTQQLTGSCSYLLLGEGSLILNLEKEMMKRKELLPQRKIMAFLIDQATNKEENHQQSFWTT